MKTRLKSFRKYFDANKPLKKFDADVFESIVEKIILGGIDDKGQKDPHQLTFVFKTGPKSTITMGKEPYPYLSPDTCKSMGGSGTKMIENEDGLNSFINGFSVVSKISEYIKGEIFNFIVLNVPKTESECSIYVELPSFKPMNINELIGGKFSSCGNEWGYKAF